MFYSWLTCGSICLFVEVCSWNVEMVSWFTSRGSPLHTRKQEGQRNEERHWISTTTEVRSGRSDDLVFKTFLSTPHLASVSVVAILSPILFVAALWALAAASAPAAPHTAGTADTVSVTWERNNGEGQKNRWGEVEVSNEACGEFQS